MEILNSQSMLNDQLHQLTEEELRGLINYEVSTKCRRTMIERLHQRYAKLVAKRQRSELITGSTLL